MESTLWEKMTGASFLSWRCRTAHIRAHNGSLYLFTWLTTTQGDGRVLLFHAPAKGYRHVAGNITVRYIMHEADFCRQAKEQVSRCDEVYCAEGCGCCDITSATVRTTEGEIVGRDYGMVCAGVSCLWIFTTCGNANIRLGTFRI
jgi:hypothetical protein